MFCFYLFIFGCAGPPLLWVGVLWFWRVGLLSGCGAGLLTVVVSLVAPRL